MAKKPRVGPNEDVAEFLNQDVLAEFLADPDVASQLEGLPPEMRAEALEMVTGLFQGEDIVTPFVPPFFESVPNRTYCEELTKQALNFLDAEPWKALGDVVLAVEIGMPQRSEGSWFGITIGRGDEFSGLAFFRSLEQMNASLFQDSDVDATIADTILFSFDDGCEDELARLVDLGWEADGQELVPALVRFDSNSQMRGVNEDELLICTLGLQVWSAMTSKFFATGQVVFDDVEVADSIEPFTFKVHHLGLYED